MTRYYFLGNCYLLGYCTLLSDTMKAEPVTLATCLLVRDLLSGTLHLTVGVKDKRRHVTEETYEVRAGPTLVLLVKDDGEVYETGIGGRMRSVSWTETPNNDEPRQPPAFLAGPGGIQPGVGAYTMNGKGLLP